MYNDVRLLVFAVQQTCSHLSYLWKKTKLVDLPDIFNHKQESPPPGNRKRRTARGVTCPPRGWGVFQSWSRGGGYPCPDWGYPPEGTLDQRLGYPSPPEGTWDQRLWSDLRPETGVPLLLQEGHGTRALLPLVNRHTFVKTVPSRRTTYAGSNNRTEII